MMNRENMQTLIDHLRSIEDHKFNMGAFQTYDLYNNCFSPACIAGHAAYMCPNNNADPNGYVSDASEIARGWLGLDRATARKLFHPYEQFAYDAKPKQAAHVCEHLLKHGVIDWSKMYKGDSNVQQS